MAPLSHWLNSWAVVATSSEAMNCTKPSEMSMMHEDPGSSVSSCSNSPQTKSPTTWGLTSSERDSVPSDPNGSTLAMTSLFLSPLCVYSTSRVPVASGATLT